MATGVHHPRVLGAIQDLVGFLDRQGVHVGTQGDDFLGAFLLAVEVAYEAVPGDVGLHLDAQGRECGFDVGRSLLLGKRKLRVGVNILALGDRIGVNFARQVLDMRFEVHS